MNDDNYAALMKDDKNILLKNTAQQPHNSWFTEISLC